MDTATRLLFLDSLSLSFPIHSPMPSLQGLQAHHICITLQELIQNYIDDVVKMNVKKSQLPKLVEAKALWVLYIWR